MGLKAGLLVNIYVVLSRDNVNELEELYALASELGVHELSFYEIVPTGRWMDHASEIMTPKDLRKFDNFVSRCQGERRPQSISYPAGHEDHRLYGRPEVAAYYPGRKYSSLCLYPDPLWKCP